VKSEQDHTTGRAVSGGGEGDASGGTGRLSGTPYFFTSRRSYREQRLLSYIHREHRRGRHLREILDDPYVLRSGSRDFVWATLRDTPLLELLDQDVQDDIAANRP
jgi:hypothetical protein